MDVAPGGGYADTDMTVVVQVKDATGGTKKNYGLITSTLDPSWYALNQNGSTLDPKISVSHGYGKSTGQVLGGVAYVDIPLYDPKAKASGLAKDAAPDANNNTGNTKSWSGYKKMQNIAKFLASEQMLNELSRAYALIKAKWGSKGAERFATLWTTNTVPKERPTFSPDPTSGEISVDLRLRKLNPFGDTDPTKIQSWSIVDNAGNTRNLKAVATADTVIKGYTTRDKAGTTYKVEDRAAKIYELRDGNEVVATLRLPVSSTYQEARQTKTSAFPSFYDLSDYTFVLTPSKLSNLASDADPAKPGFQATFNMRVDTYINQMLGFTRDDLTYNNVFYGLRNVSFIVN